MSIVSIFLLFTFIIAGAVVGSFSSAIIHRVKAGQSWIALKGKGARSQCPKCRNTLTARNLIPVLSYVIQSGRCSSCGAPISKFYIGLEILCIGLTVLNYFIFGFSAHAIYTFFVMPFIVSQIILFLQNRIISVQICAIIFAITVFYTLAHYLFS